MSEILNKGDYFTTFHLTSDYHHIKLHQENCQFIGFEWIFLDDFLDGISNFVFYHSAWHQNVVSIKVLRPFTKRLRGSGIKAIIYIDDGIPAFWGNEIAKYVTERVRNDLHSGEFVTKNKKNNFNPTARVNWLGKIIYTKELTLKRLGFLKVDLGSIWLPLIFLGELI